MARNLSEVDRKKNQFDKEERVHLLAIMKRYAPLLDKSASTLARKKIWTTIEDEFKRAGFTRKTSAQLKKYWQNYKYHCKRATAFGKETKRYVDSEEVRESLEWNRYRVFVDGRSGTKFTEVPGVVGSLADRSQTSPLESRCRPDETSPDDGETTQRSYTSDSFLDLSRVKVERNDDETMSNDSKTHGSCPPESRNFQEDSLDEKKEIFANEDRPVSSASLAGTTECKAKNRIVVSNAKISNNSVTVSVLYPRNDDARLPEDAAGGTPEAPLSRVSLPMRRIADALWSDRTETSYGSDSIKTQAADVDGRTPAVVFGRHDTMERNDNEEYRSFVRGTNDESSRERPIGERDFAAMDSEENASRGVKARNDRLESRSYVLLTDCHDRPKQRSLLQRLETEEKRLKIKIAEMAIQEVQLRIKALSEDMRRTEELHQVRLARLAAGNRDL